MNKCAKFHKDSPSDKKVKLNLPSAIELSETVVCVYNFVKKPYASEQLRWHIWPTFPLNFFMKFSHKMPLYFFYTMVQRSQKWPKTQINALKFCKITVPNFPCEEVVDTENTKLAKSSRKIEVAVQKEAYLFFSWSPSTTRSSLLKMFTAGCYLW